MLYSTVILRQGNYAVCALPCRSAFKTDFCDFGLEESILLKLPYYPRQSTDSKQALSKYQDISHRTRRNNLKIYMRTNKQTKNKNNLE